MKITTVRKFHKYLGIILSPFIILVTITAFTLLLDIKRFTILPENIESLIFKLHTWFYIPGILALFVPILLLVLAASGIMLFMQMSVKKKLKNPDSAQ